MKPTLPPQPLPAPTPRPGVTPDPWQHLRSHTSARIALGRAGTSLPTAELLRFGLAHARARDAVHLALDTDTLAQQLREASFQVLSAHSQASDRQTYLLRPDLGRQLHEHSRQALQAEPAAPALAVVVADGLSALAVQRHALPLLLALRQIHPLDWTQVPVVLAHQARVALGDGIGAALRAPTVAVLIGERPGLSSPDSLGLYLTHAPTPGRADSQRNCISNVRPEGLPYAAAARRLSYLLCESQRLGYSGVALKDNSEVPVIEP